MRKCNDQSNLWINNDFHVQKVILNNLLHCAHTDPQVVRIEYPNTRHVPHNFTLHYDNKLDPWLVTIP